MAIHGDQQLTKKKKQAALATYQKLRRHRGVSPTMSHQDASVSVSPAPPTRSCTTCGTQKKTSALRIVGGCALRHRLNRLHDFLQNLWHRHLADSFHELRHGIVNNVLHDALRSSLLWNVQHVEAATPRKARRSVFAFVHVESSSPPAP